MFKLVRVRFCCFVSYQVSAEELGTVQVDLGPHHFLPHHIFNHIHIYSKGIEDKLCWVGWRGSKISGSLAAIFRSLSGAGSTWPLASNFFGASGSMQEELAWPLYNCKARSRTAGFYSALFFGLVQAWGWFKCTWFSENGGFRCYAWLLEGTAFRTFFQLGIATPATLPMLETTWNPMTSHSNFHWNRLKSLRCLHRAGGCQVARDGSNVKASGSVRWGRGGECDGRALAAVMMADHV